MKIIILHDRITNDSRLDEIDALHQAELVTHALRTLGHEVGTVAVDLDFAALETTLRRRVPDLVFNLVESVGGHSRLIHVLPAFLEALGIPFTGCGGGAMFQTTDKLLTKKLLHGAGIPTPPWYDRRVPSESHLPLPCTCIVKPVWEDASVGIDDDAVREISQRSALDSIMEDSSKRCGPTFAEQFIDGREFNLSLLAGRDGPEALPPAEIAFVDYPTGKPRIVGYAAKWHQASFEYRATQRRFDFSPSDQPLLERLCGLALECWKLFNLRGYARVDFRADAANRPWVLEVNANPCLAADAGFMAAAQRGGLRAEQVIARIVADSTSRSSPRVSSSPTSSPIA